MLAEGKWERGTKKEGRKQKRVTVALIKTGTLVEFLQNQLFWRLSKALDSAIKELFSSSLTSFNY